MATIDIDSSIKAAIAEHGHLKIIISSLFSLLSFGRLRGWFNKAAGPQL